MLEVLMDNIEKVIDDSDESLGKIDLRLKELQHQIVQLANSKSNYDKLVQKIHDLRERKQSIMSKSAEKSGLKRRLEDLRHFLQGCTDLLTEYDEQLVRTYIQKVTVYDDRYEVEFKAGIRREVIR